MGSSRGRKGGREAAFLFCPCAWRDRVRAVAEQLPESSEVMIHFRLLISIALLTGSLVNAQTPAPKSPADKKNAPVTAKEDPDLQQRRSVALSALQSLAIEARSYREEP